MKPWTVSEVDNVLGALGPLAGTRLQEVSTSEADLLLGFYGREGMLWIWVDLTAANPCLLPWVQLPFRPPARSSPMQLFLRAHFVGRSLLEWRRSPGGGRVLDLVFTGDGTTAGLQIRLFPHGRNVIARADGKQVAWFRPNELAANVDERTVFRPRVSPPARNLDQLREEWLQTRAAKKSGGRVQDPLARRRRDLERKEVALRKVEEDLLRKRNLPWREIGHWLKTKLSLEVPSEWRPFVDLRRSLAWNMERCFEMAREAERKAAGSELRIATLRDDLNRLRAALQSPSTDESEDPVAQAELPTVKGSGARARSLKLSPQLTAMAGKSAADNLRLLRRARSWDLWFHLADYPASHLILFRNKRTPVGESAMHRVCSWYLRLHLGKKWEQHIGEKFAVLITECRFVRPIKGDKLGRVHYSNERKLIHRLADESEPGSSLLLD